MELWSLDCVSVFFFFGLFYGSMTLLLEFGINLSSENFGIVL